MSIYIRFYTACFCGNRCTNTNVHVFCSVNVIAFNLDFNQEIILHFYKCQKSFANASNIFFIMLRYIYVIRIAPGKSFTVYLIVHVYTCKIINFFYIDNHLQRSSWKKPRDVLIKVQRATLVE